MYLVTKRIEFCYGHRLLDYDGVCKHPHGHNALVEVEVRTDRLDSRNMVADFTDIKRIVKGWIDRELDHKMILRHDDPLVAPLRELGEPMYLLESNPTVERIARLIFDKGRETGRRYRHRPCVSGRPRLRSPPTRASRRTARRHFLNGSSYEKYRNMPVSCVSALHETGTPRR